MPEKKKNGGKTANKTNSSVKKASSRQPAKSRTATKKSGIDKHAIIAIACIVVAVIVCLAVVFGAILPKRRRGGGGSERPAVTEDGDYIYRRQALSYTDSVDIIDNPDQGFYRPIGVALSPSEVKYNKNIVTAATRLYHLRIDISAFSGAVNGTGDIDITDNALDGLDGLLSYLRESQKNAIVRFAYDKNYSGNKDIFQKVGQLITDSVLLDKDEADSLSNPDMASDED